MAARNYTFKFTDQGDGGSGPYVGTMFLNPTTDASGGTQTTLTYAPGAYTLKDLINRYAERATDLNAQVWDVDPEN